MRATDYVSRHLQRGECPFAFARAENASGTTSSWVTHSDRAIRGDANLDQICARFASLRTLCGCTGRLPGPRTGPPGRGTYDSSSAALLTGGMLQLFQGRVNGAPSLPRASAGRWWRTGMTLKARWCLSLLKVRWPRPFSRQRYCQTPSYPTDRRHGEEILRVTQNQEQPRG
jgi:hypothetical protein